MPRKTKLPAVAPSATKARGQRHHVNLEMTAPGGEGGDGRDNPSDPALAATVALLKELQSQRRFCIKSQSRADRTCEAFIARLMGYRSDMSEAVGKAIWVKAAAMRRAVEKDGEGQRASANQRTFALAACTLIIVNSAVARKAWDKLRSDTESKMRALARTLPAWSWGSGVKGFGELGLAIIIGETGDLALYATKERVWKRLGLAVIEGKRQQRMTDKTAAAAHGFNPQRRAEGWTLADSMFRHQWSGKTDDGPGKPAGPYGAVYAHRKAHTVTREGWLPRHRENDARRIMFKALVEDLWRVWNGKPPLDMLGHNGPPRA